MHCTLLILLAGLLVLTVRAADFDIKDDAEFSKIVPKDAKLQKLAGGMTFLEGPVWMAADGGYLLFSDIPADELKKWTAKDGVTTFRKPSHNANGNSLTTDGLLITCEHSARRVTRTEKDGAVTVLADSYEGKKLNSPNDLVMRSDGLLYFTDPTYGVPKGEKKEQPKNFVFLLNPKTKELKTVADDFDMPNGLCFSPDEKKLYIADSGKPHHIRVFDVKADGTLAGGAVFCVIDVGLPDGIRCDTAGRLYSSAGDGVQIFTPAGALIGKILVPESPANLCFGGPVGRTVSSSPVGGTVSSSPVGGTVSSSHRNTLFLTARKSLYSIPLSVAGR